VVSFGECVAVHTEDPADGPYNVGAAPLSPKPTTPRDAYVRSSRLR
jgi:hypothetical protein